MYYKRRGYPEVDEIVLCQVTKIFPSSVFVDLLEYGNISGLVHISEVAPGRIRNLRDFVSEGRQIVCKILRIDREKGHIDLSLRRVNSTQRMEKMDEIKQELKAEQLVKNLAKRLKTSPESLYKDITEALFKSYSHLYLCFKDIAEEAANLEKLGLKKDVAEPLKEMILEKFRPAKVTIDGEIILQTYHPDGVERIKALLQNVLKLSDTISLAYLGAGRHKLVVESPDYKAAEDFFEKVESVLQTFNDKLSTASVERKSA